MEIKMKKTDETADLHPLFCQYGQNAAQPAYIEIDLDNEKITADMTDDQVEAIAQRETQESRENDFSLLNAYEYFIQKRDQAIEETSQS